MYIIYAIITHLSTQKRKKFLTRVPGSPRWAATDLGGVSRTIIQRLIAFFPDRKKKCRVNRVTLLVNPNNCSIFICPECPDCPEIRDICPDFPGSSSWLTRTILRFSPKLPGTQRRQLPGCCWRNPNNSSTYSPEPETPARRGNDFERIMNNIPPIRVRNPE